MIKLIAKKLGVPFVKGDATKFSETGYVGGDVEDLVRDLYWEADGDLEKARFGIIYLDEIDKIASSGDIIGPDVSRTGVQRALLKPLEETEVEIKVQPENVFPFDSEEKKKKRKITINTKYVLFVVSGAFHGLEEIIKKRLKKSSLGFLSEVEGRSDVKVNYLKFTTPEDLVAYGFEREFVGRLPVIAVCDPLTEEDLFEILANPNSAIVLNKKRDFKVYGIDLAFTDSALRLCATLAYKEGTGARALLRVLEKALIPFEKTLPSLNVEHLGVTEELICDPQGYLATFLNNPRDSKWEEVYLQALKEEKERFLRYLELRKHRYLRTDVMELTPQRLNLLFELYKFEDVELSVVLEEMLNLYRQIKGYEATFSRRNQIQAVFTDEAIDYIINEVLRNDRGVFSFCEKALSRIEYALLNIRDIQGRKKFYITPLAFTNPEKYIEDLISFRA
jgi:ATP-dependent protease Clp ATPase subunit